MLQTSWRGVLETSRMASKLPMGAPGNCRVFVGSGDRTTLTPPPVSQVTISFSTSLTRSSVRGPDLRSSLRMPFMLMENRPAFADAGSRVPGDAAGIGLLRDK